MRTLIVIGSMMLCLGGEVHAQGTDPRMEKDLDVMERILEEMFTSSVRGSFRGKAKAEYTDGYGIVINTPVRSFSVFAPAITKSNGSNVITRFESERDRDFDEEVVEDLMRKFIASYGDLASGLKKGEKLMVVFETAENSNGRFFIDEDRDSSPDRITAVISKEDLDSFRKGGMSEDDFQKKIEVNRTNTSTSKGPFEYKMFGNILKDILGESEKDNFHINVGQSDERVIRINGLGRQPRVSHQILEGYGVTYSLRFPSNSIMNVRTNKSGKVRKISRMQIDSEDGDGEYEEAHDKHFMVNYQNAVNQIKNAMIEYGRTLREMNAEELLVVKLDLGGCYNCEAPAEIHLQVKKSVLEQYDRRDIDLDDATAKIKLTESGKASDVDIRLPFFIDVDDSNFKFDFDWDWE